MRFPASQESSRRLPAGQRQLRWNFPNAVHTRAYGINPGTAIVLQYVDTNKQAHGFLAVPVSAE